MLAIALCSVLVGVGGSRKLDIGRRSASPSPSTRLLLLVAGVAGILAGIGAFRQMDDKPGVRVLADLWGSLRGRPLCPAEPSALARRVRGLRGRRGRRQVHPGRRARRARCAAEGRDVVVTREPGATDVGRADPRAGARPGDDATCHPGPRRCSTPPTGPTTWPPSSGPRWPAARVVISDRYVDSSLAYQGAGRTLPVDEVSWLSSWATGGLKPDLVVLLDVEPTVGLARAAGPRRGRPAGDRVAGVPRAGPVRVPRPGRRRPAPLPGARRAPGRPRRSPTRCSSG